MALKEVVYTEVENMLRLGVVRPSHSPWSSPTVMVHKKDGSCAILCRFPESEHCDAYPLPRIDATLDTLNDCYNRLRVLAGGGEGGGQPFHLEWPL
jgi:hypothetical protein